MRLTLRERTWDIGISTMKYRPIKPGSVFGDLTVIEHVYLADDEGNHHHCSKCRCTCGNEIVVLNTSLRYGNTISCGCSRVKKIKQRCTTHGDGNRKVRLYRIWSAMKQRCYRPRYEHFADYGGRGIRVCDEWLHDYMAFKKWAYANGYDDSKSIDRIDPNGNYEPSNCRWANWTEQQRNKRSNCVITVNGISLSVSAWSERLGVSSSMLYQFRHRGGDLELRIRELEAAKC